MSSLRMVSFTAISKLIRNWFPTVCYELAPYIQEKLDIYWRHYYGLHVVNGDHRTYNLKRTETKATIEMWSRFYDLITGPHDGVGKLVIYGFAAQSENGTITKERFSEYMMVPEWEAYMHCVSLMVHIPNVTMTWWRYSSDQVDRGSLFRNTAAYRMWQQRYVEAFHFSRTLKDRMEA